MCLFVFLNFGMSMYLVVLVVLIRKKKGNIFEEAAFRNTLHFRSFSRLLRREEKSDKGREVTKEKVQSTMIATFLKTTCQASLQSSMETNEAKTQGVSVSFQESQKP